MSFNQRDFLCPSNKLLQMYFVSCLLHEKKSQGDYDLHVALPTLTVNILSLPGLYLCCIPLQAASHYKLIQ
jgi:hypothetical protein